MTLAGTRPILQDELLKYELHHRARIAIKPGITGMWQVSGRSDITDFEEVVRLDTEYIIIYFMLLCNQSNFSEIYMTPYRTIIMLILLGVFLIKAKGKIKTYCFLFISFLVAYALLLR